MPELPDLETFAHNLRPLIVNKKIVAIQVKKPRSVLPLTANEFAKKSVNQTVSAVRRRGKQLVFSLSAGGELCLHLMLHGEMFYQPGRGERPLTILEPGQIRVQDRSAYEGRSQPQFTCLEFEFADSSQLFLADSTQWLKVSFTPLAKGGIEPLAKEFTSERLKEIVKKKKLGSVKDLLMDQKRIAGIGNAYADEILWQAKIQPGRVASLLKDDEIISLHQAVETVLLHATAEVRKRIRGGITGEVRDFLNVHDRKNKPCPRCQTPIRLTLVKGRGTYFCSKCQR